MPRKKANLALVPDEKRPRETVKKTSPTAPKMSKSVQDDPELREVWEELVPEMEEAGLLAACDSITIEMLIRHLVLARKAYIEMGEDESMLMWDHKNDRYQKHPLEAIFRLQSKEVRDYAHQLGMTFLARSKRPKPIEDDGDNPFIGATGS